MLTPDAVVQDGGEASVGPEGFYPFFGRMHGAFSGIHCTLHDTIAEDDKVSCSWSCMMWHTGDGLGVPATNKCIESNSFTIKWTKAPNAKK